MKDVELKLISELMKNSRRSDRELAKAIGVSQPTVGRMLKKFQKDGVIKEFTVMPDFRKLGFQMMSFTLAKFKNHVSEDAVKEARKELRKMLSSEDVSTILTMRGAGDADYIIVAFHESYDAYNKFIDLIKQQPLIPVKEARTFIASLTESHFRPLSFSTLAEYMAKMKTKKITKA